MIFRRTTAVVLAVGTLGITAGVSPVEAANVTIKGTLGAVNQGYKVLLVTSAGATVTATADSTGAFQFVTSKAASNKASLQLVDTKNRYAGPVVIAKQKAGTTYCANTRLAGKSVNLGALTMSGGAAITKKAPKSTTYLAAGVPAKSKAGIPTAAGTAGIVRMTALAKKKAACSKAKTGVRARARSTRAPCSVPTSMLTVCPMPSMPTTTATR